MAHAMTRRPILIGVLAILALLAGSAILLAACGVPVKDPRYADVSIDGKKFHLELALDQEKRFKGLSGRDQIPENGGMLFVFPAAQELGFVMRDCPVDID